MPVPGKYFWGIADPLLPKGNLIDYIVSDIHKRAAQCIVHLPVQIDIFLRNGKFNHISLFISAHTHQIHKVLSAADTDGTAISVYYFQR